MRARECPGRARTVERAMLAVPGEELLPVNLAAPLLHYDSSAHGLTAQRTWPSPFEVVPPTFAPGGGFAGLSPSWWASSISWIMLSRNFGSSCAAPGFVNTTRLGSLSGPGTPLSASSLVTHPLIAHPQTLLDAN
jgi:hypothetical protein